jgi:transcriptional regulator with XRE-family HTH domain
MEMFSDSMGHNLAAKSGQHPARICFRRVKNPQLNEIVRRSGVTRLRVSAVKNGATVSVSCDLLVKIIGAMGVEVQPNAA